MDTPLTKTKKYIGSCCGNSFIIVDCRNVSIERQLKSNFARENIAKYGVDSALFLNNAEGFDVHIQIFEQDGSESDSCGNGIILITYFLNLAKGKVKMKNSVVSVEGNAEKEAISMDVKFSSALQVGTEKNCVFVKIGEPHLVYLVPDAKKFDLIKFGEMQQKNYPAGVNVNAVQQLDHAHCLIRTYERGVFAETKSCGTGSLSSFIALSILQNKIYNDPVEFKSAGGSHWISRDKNMMRLETLRKFCEIKTLDLNLADGI